jgi:oligopeptide transport system substrate-binding protein
MCSIIRSIAKALIAVIAACWLVACSGGDSGIEEANRQGILHFGNGTEPQSLDPHVMTGVPEVTIARALFEGLVTISPHTLEPEPGVAQSWTLSEDQRLITFQINPDARWSNGDPVTAQNFVWSWQRVLNPKFASLNAETLFPIKNAEAIATGVITDPSALGAKALDALTLEVTLNEPTPYFLTLLGTYTTYPVHRQTIEKFGAASDHYTRWTRVENIVSNGAFKLKKWQLNRHIVVEKSELYWNADRVRLNGIVFHPIDNTVTEERMFRAQQLHYTAEVPLDKIPLYEAMDPSPLRRAPYLGTYYFQLNTTRAPINDIRVRRALAMAIDRQTLVDTVLQNIYLPNYNFTPVGLQGYQSAKLFEYDPDAARRLMAEAGYADGENWPGLELTYNTSKQHRKIAIAVQQMWKKTLNIDVTLANLEWKVYLDKTQQMDYQIARAAWVGSYLDPGTFLRLFIADGGNNGTGFASAEFDDLVFQQAAKTRTREQRYAVFAKAESLLIEQMPIIPLFSYTSNHLVQPSVKGLGSNILDNVNFNYIWLENTVLTKDTQ